MWSGPLVDAHFYEPIMKPEYFHLIGHGVFVRPEWGDDVALHITLDWRNIGEEWVLANSFGSRTAAKGFTQSMDIDFNKLLHAVYLGGDYRLHRRDLNGRKLYIALRGAWQFKDEEFAAIVTKIVAAERAFWKDSGPPTYLVALSPTDPESPSSIHGTGLTNSFTMLISLDNGLSDTLIRTLAHEHFHNWNASQIGSMESDPNAPDERDEVHRYWFSEGFTNYYARLLLLRSGLWSWSSYLADLNQALNDYYTSPAVTATNDVIASRFFADRALELLPYMRG